MVGVAMDHQIGPPFIDRFRQKVTSEKRKNSKLLAREGLRDRRVVEKRDFLICLKCQKRAL